MNLAVESFKVKLGDTFLSEDILFSTEKAARDLGFIFFSLVFSYRKRMRLAKSESSKKLGRAEGGEGQAPGR